LQHKVFDELKSKLFKIQQYQGVLKMSKYFFSTPKKSYKYENETDQTIKPNQKELNEVLGLIIVFDVFETTTRIIFVT